MLKISRTALLFACAASSVGRVCHREVRGRAIRSYVARDVSTLYTAAKRTMDHGDYEQAAKLFDEVERQHPYSVWARRAQLMSAFNYYLAQKYNGRDQLCAAVRDHPSRQRRSALRAISDRDELLSADRRT